jgi:hypothetical protein
MSASPASRTPHPLHFQIAGIPFSVLSEHPVHDRWLRTTYRRFTVSQAPRIHLSIQTSRHKSLGIRSAEQVYWDGPRWILESKYFHIREVEPRRSYRATAASHVGIADLMRTWFSAVLLGNGGILLHAGAVVRAGRAIVFSGPSGSGKTTLARLAGQQLVLSDESVAIAPGPTGRNGNNVLYAFGTPFFGEMTEGVVNDRAPVGEVFLISANRSLVTGDPCRVADVSPAHSVGELLAQTFLRSLSRDALEALFPILEAFVDSVRIRRLEFTPTPDVWRAIDDLCG